LVDVWSEKERGEKRKEKKKKKKKGGKGMLTPVTWGEAAGIELFLFRGQKEQKRKISKEGKNAGGWGAGLWQTGAQRENEKTTLEALP